jgi:hypothetical protein
MPPFVFSVCPEKKAKPATNGTNKCRICQAVAVFHWEDRQPGVAKAAAVVIVRSNAFGVPRLEKGHRHFAVQRSGRLPL